jgi:raffinose/stachyose/melibiose transport system substrate-binding protein
MKKVIRSMFLICIVAALLAACGPAATATVEAPAATSAPEATSAPAAAPTEAATAAPAAAASGCTLHIIGGARTYPGEEDAWNEVFAAFKKEYNCDVVARWQGEWSDAPKNLETARMAKEPVDITYNSATLNSTMARSGILMDITNLVTPYQDRFATGMLDKYTLGGKVWAIPVSDSSTSAFFYNATMFKELGLSEPKTYADLVNVAKTIKDKKGIQPLIHQGKATYYWPMWFMETYAQTTGNKSIDDINQFLSGTRKFTNPEEIAALNAIAQFYKDGLLNQSDLDTDGDAMRAAFLQQKAAMFYGGTWELAALRQANPTFDIGVFQFPLVVDTAGVTSQHGGGPDNAWSIPSFIDPKNLPMAAQFLEFITRQDNATKIISTYSPMIPSIKSVPVSSDPLASKFNTEFMPNTITFLDWLWPSEVNDAVMQVIPQVLTGNTTAEDAAQTVQDAYDTVVAEKDYSYNWWDKWTQDDWAKVTPQSVPTIEVK